jgi:hypothetical protein
MNERESEQIKRWLAYERREGRQGDREAARKIERLFDLRRTTPLDRMRARDDLNVVGYFRR